MSKQDARGVPVSEADAKAVDRFETALHLLNGFYADPLAVIDEAIAERPRFVMGHCLRAGLFLIAAEKAAESELRRSVEAAEALAPVANDRERGHIAATRAWLDGDYKRAADLYEKVLSAYPRDLLALQIAHQCDFFLGQAVYLRDRVARVMPWWREGDPGYGFVLGMHAFGLEETNDFRRAEETGRRAVALNPRDPWAIHAVAHVMEMEGRIEDGIDWLSSRADDWSPDNMFAFHNWWHLALYHLDRGETDRVLAIYDQSIKPRQGGMALEYVDATALLWRLTLRGVDVGPRWQVVADAWEPLIDDAYYAFNDMHLAMAMVGSGRVQAGERHRRALERVAAEGRGTNATLTREIGLPIARALYAFGAGDYPTTVDLLMSVRPNAHRFGGSNAQRDVIALTLLEAAFRAGDAKLARALAAERVAMKPSSPFNWATTARALRLLGDETGAAQAMDRARAA